MFKNFILICFLILKPTVALATHWPIFTVPNTNLLLQLNYLDTKNCEPGSAKLLTNKSITIQDHLCKNFCPGIWSWITSSDEICHSLENGFQFKNFESFYYKNKDEVVEFTVIVAGYGDVHVSEPYAKLIFTSLPGDYWKCDQLAENKKDILCSNDI